MQDGVGLLEADERFLSHGLPTPLARLPWSSGRADSALTASQLALEEGGDGIS
jgi:hypothetical protein